MITREIIIGFSGNPPLNTDSIYERRLIRCKDCKNFDTTDCFWKLETGGNKDPDWFCADGEEKDRREKRGMDNEAIIIVENYVMEHLDKSDPEPEFETYIVWKCKALQNWKYLISTSLLDGMYYELTYNGNMNEWYLDAYKKFENRKIPALFE
jgi:hypothetical protein